MLVFMAVQVQALVPISKVVGLVVMSLSVVVKEWADTLSLREAKPLFQRGWPFKELVEALILSLAAPHRLQALLFV